MATTEIRPRAIVLLSDVDPSRSDGPEHLYHRDGRPLSIAEYDLFATCTQAEIDIAVAYMQPVGDGMSERYKVQKALISLYMKYAHQLPDAFPDSASGYDLMTDEDYAEFERLVEVLGPGDGFEEHTAHEED
ncbi:hypothetical protein OH828_20730 [Streptomyces anulatus]|uniref:hypothetical protein n=1 Tax=Streptomyces anulatus TaxID=1892 RepID=UPI00386751C3